MPAAPQLLSDKDVGLTSSNGPDDWVAPPAHQPKGGDFQALIDAYGGSSGTGARPTTGGSFSDLERAYAKGSGPLSDADVGLSSSSGMFDDLIPARSSTGTDVAKGFGSGLAHGAESLIGMGGDVRHAVDYGALWAEAKAAEKMGYLPKGQSADDVIQKYRGSAGRAFLSQLGVPDTAIDWLGGGAPTTEQVRGVATAAGVPDYQAQTQPGQYAQTIGEFIPGAVAAPAKSALGVGANALRYGVLPALGSEWAGQMTKGTAAEPYARMAGAVGTGLGAAGAEASGRAAVNAGKAFVEPMSEAGQRTIAARKLAGAFTDPAASSKALNDAADAAIPGQALGEIVPGSKPTTGQLTGDLGALSLERELATRQPDLYKSNEFGTGAEQQNAAQSAALKSLQPVGAPGAVAQTVRDQLAAIDKAHDAAVEAATRAHENDVAAATAVHQAAGDALQAGHDATVSGALGTAQEAAGAVGAGATPEAQGAALRAALADARAKAKTNERTLWNAVDPDGTLALPSDPVTAKAAELSGSVPSTAKPMGGEEKAIFGTVANLPAITPFNDMTALRGRISTAMREELRASGQSPTYARLSELRGAVENAIENAAQEHAAQEARAVAQGTLSPQATMEARVNEWRRNFYAAREDAVAASGVGLGVNQQF